MDFDLEIISEESDCPDPLFDSIMNAMNSMKEATADKIYQKIQREGETNYSKPQVDRALASALKYGIFEVKNSRYRVRDDILDDEDTVYWKLQKRREQTPFRIQDNMNERHFGPKLDPEKDNQRFKKVPVSEPPECPQCGRVKKLDSLEEKTKLNKKTKNGGGQKGNRRRLNKRHTKTEANEADKVKSPVKKRKTRSYSDGEERQNKMRRTLRLKSNQATKDYNLVQDPFTIEENEKLENLTPNVGKYDSSDSELQTISSPSDDEQSFMSYGDEEEMMGQKHKKPFKMLSECDDIDRPDNMTDTKESSVSLKTESESGKSEILSGSEDNSHGRPSDAFQENLPCTSRNAGSKELENRNQYLTSNDVYSKQYDRNQADHCERKSDWMRCSDEPQGAIIQSNNVLTIEPMDSLAFSSPGQATYIS